MGEVNPLPLDQVEDNKVVPSRASAKIVWDTSAYPSSAPSVPSIHDGERCS